MLYLCHPVMVMVILILLVCRIGFGLWGMCTTSVECKTVIIVMLKVMSGMDPHMISGNLGWVLLCFGCVVSKWVLLGCGSVTVRVRDAIEASSLRR
jgi:hypothetical protein